jgi:hypothetical protein
MLRLTLIIILFILSLTTAKADDQFFIYRANEIKINNHFLAKLIYDSLKGDEIEANLVSEQYFKHDKFFFCIKDLNESNTPYQCSIYLKEEMPWRLANFEEDTDFGKSEFFTALYEKEFKGTGTIEIFNNRILFTIKGQAASKIKKTILEIPQFKTINDKIIQVKCLVKSETCSITIPIYHDKLQLKPLVY